MKKFISNLVDSVKSIPQTITNKASKFTTNFKDDFVDIWKKNTDRKKEATLKKIKKEEIDFTKYFVKSKSLKALKNPDLAYFLKKLWENFLKPLLLTTAACLYTAPKLISNIFTNSLVKPKATPEIINSKNKSIKNSQQVQKITPQSTINQTTTDKPKVNQLKNSGQQKILDSITNESTKNTKAKNTKTKNTNSPSPVSLSEKELNRKKIIKPELA